MLKYLVGRAGSGQPDAPAFMEPFIIVHAKDREAALKKYDSHFSEYLVPGQKHAGMVIGLVTIFGPMNLDPQCSREAANAAMKSAIEVGD